MRLANVSSQEQEDKDQDQQREENKELAENSDIQQ